MLLTASLPPTLNACWMSSLSSISSTIYKELESKPDISNRFFNSVIASPSLWSSCEIFNISTSFVMLLTQNREFIQKVL